MAARTIYLSGDFLPESDAKVSVFDRGFLLGDGIFETIRVYDGAPFAFDLHLERMFVSLEALRIEIPETKGDLRRACHELLQRNSAADTVLRITITRGAGGGLLLSEAESPTRLIHLRDLQLPSAVSYEQGVRALIASTPFSKPRSLYGHKTTGYLENIIAKDEAAKRGAFEALLGNADGELIEGASTNVFVVKNGKVVTPPISSGALPGITRRLCIDLLEQEEIPVSVKPVLLSEVDSSDEIFLTNSVIEIVPVTTIGTVVLSNHRPGSIYSLLAKRYRELITKGYRP